MPVDAPVAQLVGDDAGGADLFEADLRMRVEVAADFLQRIKAFEDLGDDGHGALLG